RALGTFRPSRTLGAFGALSPLQGAAVHPGGARAGLQPGIHVVGFACPHIVVISDFRGRDGMLQLREGAILSEDIEAASGLTLRPLRSGVSLRPLGTRLSLGARRPGGTLISGFSLRPSGAGFALGALRDTE